MKMFLITQIKDFMNKLLRTELFDHFLLSEASIQGAATYVIDGRLTKEFFTMEELEAQGLNGLSYAPFSLLRTSCYDLIRGKKTPVSFRFVFRLSPDNLARALSRAQSANAPEDLDGAFLNVKYDDGRLTLTTGISYKTFSRDRSFEQYWDSLAEKFLAAHGIAFEALT